MIELSAMYQSYLQSRGDTSDTGTSESHLVGRRDSGDCRFVTTGIQVETTALQGTQQNVKSPWGRGGGRNRAKGRGYF
jgi:hypothetical protein